jgi:sugar phosphate permease
LFWLPMWARWQPRGSQLSSIAAVKPPGVALILHQRSFWAAATGHFCGNYLFYFLTTWLPLYLVRERHLSLAMMAKTAGTLYLLDGTAALITGWVADTYVRRGVSTTVVRKTAMAVGCILAPIGLAGGVLSGPDTYLAWLAVAAIACGIEGSGTFAFSQTLAGPAAAGMWTGLQNGVANLAGAVGLALTGFVVDATGHFRVAFVITGGIILCGGLAWVFGVEQVEPVAWPNQPPVVAVPTLGETA